MCVLAISRPSSNMGHVGLTSRSPGQILEKSCLHSTGHICDWILMKLGQNEAMKKGNSSTSSVSDERSRALWALLFNLKCVSILTVLWSWAMNRFLWWNWNSAAWNNVQGIINTSLCQWLCFFTHYKRKKMLKDIKKFKWIWMCCCSHSLISRVQDYK